MTRGPGPGCTPYCSPRRPSDQQSQPFVYRPAALMRTCLRRSLATGLVFRRQLPLAPRCYAFLPGCGQGLALATTARPAAPLRSALLLRSQASPLPRIPSQLLATPTIRAGAATLLSERHPTSHQKFQFRAAAFAPASALSLALCRLATLQPPGRHVAGSGYGCAACFPCPARASRTCCPFVERDNRH